MGNHFILPNLHFYILGALYGDHGGTHSYFRSFCTLNQHPLGDFDVFAPWNQFGII